MSRAGIISSLFLLTAAWAGAGPAQPVPLRRVLLTPDRLPQEVKRVRQGALVRLPRDEFEELVRRATREAGREAPQLVEARYRAALAEESLVGTGQWKVVHAGPGPGLLNLQPNPQQPFNLALKQPRFENRDALVAEFDGKNLALLVDEPGEHPVALEWSARGEARPEGLYFDLRVPPCPVALLELDVPADRVVAVLDRSLLSGPHPAEKADRRLWKVACGGRGQVRLLVRRPARAEGRPLLLARQKTVQGLNPEGVDATFEFTLEALHEGVRELVCECDPSLRPREVVVPNLDTWEFRPGSAPGSPAVLTVRLREPLREGTLQVSCLAPLAIADRGSRIADSPNNPQSANRDTQLGGAAAWTSPWVRLRGAVPRGEALELSFHPDLRVEDWHAGGFRVTRTAPADQEHPVSPQHLSLTGGGVGPEGAPAGTPPRRPGARVRSGGVQFRARQLAWWQLRAAGMTLTLQTHYEVTHGQLFELPVLLPDGWETDEVELTPPRLLHNWGVRPAAGGPPDGGSPAACRQVLAVDLQHPLTAGPGAGGAAASRGATLTVRLRPVRPGPVTGRKLPFPEAVPLGARFREGALAIEFDEQANAAALETTAARSNHPEEDGPWGKQLPAFYFPYRGGRVRGALLLRPRPPQVRARCTTAVFVASGRAAVEERLVVEAEGGHPDTVDLELSAGGGGPWDWRVEQGGNQVRRAERLHAPPVAGVVGLLAAGNAVEAAALQAARPQGERWRLTLARPLWAREPLLLYATRKLERTAGGWQVPLPSVLGAARMEGEVTLHLTGADVVQVEAAGLREAPPATRTGGGAPATTPPAPGWRTFRYGPGAVALALRGQAPTADRTVEGIDGARLTTYVGADGALQHHFTFRVTNWSRRALPLRLPPRSWPVAVRVDGRWLPRPDFVAEGEDAGLLRVPVPERGEAAADGPHHFEVVYAGGVPAWSLWARVEAPAPGLPVPPTTVRRSWRLPPGVRPLGDGRQRRVPGPGEGFSPADGEHRPADLFRLAGSPAHPWAAPAGAAEQGQALADAAVSLRSGLAGQDVTLKKLVDQVALDYLKGHAPLVVDTTALREAGVGPQTRLPVRPPAGTDDRALPWEERGLVALFARPAVLLTTRRQCELWRASAALAPAPSPSLLDRRLAAPLTGALEGALAEAAADGRDASGRFRSALDWGMDDSVRAPAGLPPRPLPSAEGSLTPWTEWEPVAGTADDAGLVVVRRDVVTAAGLALATALVLAFLAVRRLSGRKRLGMVLAWLALAGLGVLWLPGSLQDLAWWPLLAGCLTAVLCYLSWAARGLTRSAPSTRLAAGGAALGSALVLLGAVGSPPGLRGGGPADDPAAPVTVYLVPGPSGAPGKQTVLAPPELLDRLRAMSKLAPGGPGAVLVAADYDGKVAGGVADFGAVFQVQGLTDGPTTLALPLGGVQLYGDVWLDGARAYPVALPPPQAGYALPVKGRGRHKVELRFRVPVLGGDAAGAGGGREVQFTPPRLAQNRLALALPAGATSVQAPARHGAQRVSTGPDGKRLEVELGNLSTPLHLRWYEEPRPARPAKVEYREAYLWVLRGDASSLTALLRYRVTQGAVTKLAVDLPPELEVQGAEAHRPADLPAAGGIAPTTPPGRPAGPAGVRLRDWRVTGPGPARWLELEFQGPVSGECEVTLDLVPRGPLGATAQLPLPAPRGEPVPEGSYLAYRLEGLRAQPAALRIKGISPADFAPFWPASSRPDPRSLAYAGSFRREGGQGPVLNVHLQASAPVAEARQDVELRVGPRQAQVRATLELTAPGNDLSLLEWEVQSARPLTVAGVTGPDVRGWSRAGNRVLVWLSRTTGQTALELSGWLPLAGTGNQGMRLDVPSLRPSPSAVALRSQVTYLHLTAEGEVSLEPTRLQGLLPLPDVQELGYVAEQPSYAGSFRVRPGAGPAARVLMFAEVQDRQLLFTATIDCQVRGGGPRTVSVRLRNWEGPDVSLEAPGAGLPRVGQRRSDDRTWPVDLPAGARGSYRLRLRGSMPVEAAAAGVPMPDVSVAGVARAERWVAVAGGALSVEAAMGLAPAARPAEALRPWPGVAERVRRTEGAVWRVRGPDWGLRLLPHDRPGGPAPVRVFLAEHAAAVVDGRGWLHETVYWLRHEAHTDLRVSFPAGAEVVGVSVDGREVAPLQSGPGRLWLPLPGWAGVRQIQLRWLYEGGAEKLEAPNLERPRLEGAEEGPALWTAYVPAGWEAARSEGRRLGTGPVRAAAVALYRAEAQLRISRALADHVREGDGTAQLAAAQGRFTAACRHAEQALALAGRPAVLPGGRPLGAWLQVLQAENRDLSQHHALERVRAAAGRRAREGAAAQDVPAGDDGQGPAEGAGREPPGGAGGVFPDRGTPVTWQAGPGEPAPRLRLASEESRAVKQALIASGPWLAMLAAVWALSLSPLLLAWVRLFWPEPFTLLGALGWYVAGPTVVVLLLLVLGVGGRVFHLGRGVRRLLRRRTPAPASSAGGSGSHG